MISVTLEPKEFEKTEPEPSKHLSNANRISSQIAYGLKAIFSTSGKT
jgi:hypothetical protein